MPQPTISERVVTGATSLGARLATPLGQLGIFFLCLLLAIWLVYLSIWQPLTTTSSGMGAPVVPQFNTQALSEILSERETRATARPPTLSLSRFFTTVSTTEPVP